MGKCELCGSNPCTCPPITAARRVSEEVKEMKAQLKAAEKVLKAIKNTSKHVQPSYLVELSREYFKTYGEKNGNL